MILTPFWLNEARFASSTGAILAQERAIFNGIEKRLSEGPSTDRHDISDGIIGNELEGDRFSLRLDELQARLTD